MLHTIRGADAQARLGFSGSARSGQPQAHRPQPDCKRSANAVMKNSSQGLYFGRLLQPIQTLAKALVFVTPLLVLPACKEDKQDAQLSPPAVEAPAIPGMPVPETRPVARPASAEASALYLALINPQATLAELGEKIAVVADLSETMGGRSLLATGLLRAADEGSTALADLFLVRVTAEQLGERNATGMNLLMLMAGETSEGGVRVFNRVLAAMKEKGVITLGAPDNFQWNLAHHLAFYGNEGALKRVLSDPDALGHPKDLLSAKTRGYTYRNHRGEDVTGPGHTPLELAQAQLASKTPGANLAVDKRLLETCSAPAPPADMADACADLRSTRQRAQERLDAERSRLEKTLRLIEQALAS